MNGSTRYHRGDLDTLQTRFALRVASRLSERSSDLPRDLSERLRVSREQAVARARQLRLAQPATVPGHAWSQGSVTLGESPPAWLRLASLLPLMLLVLGLVLIQQLVDQAEIDATADVDTALLADDLPPEAYGDPGFVAFLKQREP